MWGPRVGPPRGAEANAPTLAPSEKVGRYVAARRRLRRAEVEHGEASAAKDQRLIGERAEERHVDELVRLSGMTGKPTLMNPATRQVGVSVWGGGSGGL